MEIVSKTRTPQGYSKTQGVYPRREIADADEDALEPAAADAKTVRVYSCFYNLFDTVGPFF